MKNIIASRFNLLLFVCITLATASFAGTGRVRFGAYTAGQGCSGTGICQSGSVGALVTFNFYQNTDTAGGTFTKLSMLANYDQAIANGFIGNPEGGVYTFTGGYTFNHPGDQNMGVPATYSIPDNFECYYGPKDINGRITLVITQFKINK